MLIGATHCDPIVNLHSEYHVIGGDGGVTTWPIRGLRKEIACGGVCRNRNRHGADALDRRPQLVGALAKARKAKVPVVVMAKLCRLSRDVALRHPFRKRHPRRPANCAAILVNR